MCKINLIVVSFMCCVAYSASVGIFHDNTRITFRPDAVADFFGYSILLTDSGLVVGAPKAKSRYDGSIAPGLVFNCPLTGLDARNVTCRPMEWSELIPDSSVFTNKEKGNFFKDDMWFGAVVVPMPDKQLLICAPRWSVPYGYKYVLAHGACFIKNGMKLQQMLPLTDPRRQAYKTQGERKEYGDFSIILNYYAYGQAGMSAKVTENDTIILGAPGLMQWTGGIVEYNMYPNVNEKFATNSYRTLDLGPDDYLGYSIESGIFDNSGKALYVAGAPRSKDGYGQVLIFEQSTREIDPLIIHAKVQGSQVGAYFGATVRCADVNGDGIVDLLVGAPIFVKKNGDLPYDQGAVFVYLTERGRDETFVLKEAEHVTGSEQSGARFGSTIADLGDVDGDGFTDIAVGAPWENGHEGVVYIYKGSKTGLKTQYAQRIMGDGTVGFGMAISRGMDVDGNNCNDLAVGAHNSGEAFVYRCVPTMSVLAEIKVPDATNLPQNATNFTALFCIKTPKSKKWPNIKIDLKAKITVDPGSKRARLAGDSEYDVTVKPGNYACEEQTIEVESTADLSKPINIKFRLETTNLTLGNSTIFEKKLARLSEDSVLLSSFDIQLTGDCGDDLFCRPLINMNLKPFTEPYVPGSNDKLGFTITVLNEEEPAYGAKVRLELPSSPKRLPSDCSLKDLNVTCDIPSPLLRGQSVMWEIEMEPTKNMTIDKKLVITAGVEDVLHKTQSEIVFRNLTIQVKPTAEFVITGKSLPNISLPVTRDKLREGGKVNFTHYFEVMNLGPSDWLLLKVKLRLPEKANLSSPVKGCVDDIVGLDCEWPLPAKVSIPLSVPLYFDLKANGGVFEENSTINVTTTLVLLLKDKEKSTSTTTTLTLKPAQPIWPTIVGLVAGLLLLAAIVLGLHKYGFFSRKSRDELRKLQEQPLIQESSASSSGKTSDAEDSVREIDIDSN